MCSETTRVRKEVKTEWRKRRPPRKRRSRVCSTPRWGVAASHRHSSPSPCPLPAGVWGGGRGGFFICTRGLVPPPAAGAAAEPLGGPAHHGPYRDQVGQPAPFAHVVGMADPVAEGRTFPAEITALRHRGSLEGDVGLLQPSTFYSISR